jgi:hypothetical protein
MSRVMRLAIAMLLAVAVGAVPLVRERCAETCDAHRVTTESAPACHHTTSTAIRITTAPAPCGHDHHSTSVGAPKSFSPTDRTFAWMAIVVGHGPVASPSISEVHDRRHSPPDCFSPPALCSLPLRV